MPNIRNSEGLKITDWLPTSKKEMEKRGWDEVDVVLFSADAYIDHPSFGAAVVGRILEDEGYRVAIVPQPNWQDDLRDFKKFGRPRLFFAISGGSMDSMVNHYTANRRLRSDDAYTAGGKAGQRPDYATYVYSNICKQLFPDVPVIIGGIEASLRRLTHYDYWQDKLKPSILAESKADLLVYGMGEKPIVEIASRLSEGYSVDTLTDIAQTAFTAENNIDLSHLNPLIRLNSFEECVEDKVKFALNFKHIEEESNKYAAAYLAEPVGDRVVVVNPPHPKLTEAEMDHSFDLPYTRLPHPRYNGKGAIPAYDMIKFSVNAHRGCFGGCSFCTISAHQGKFISSRSEASILKEIEEITHHPEFKGYISDLGGPSANMYQLEGRLQEMCQRCKRASCLFPNVCQNLDNNHARLLELYRRARAIPGIKKIFIGSGIRYDLFMGGLHKTSPANLSYLEEVMLHHVSGRLKVAPEHTSDEVLKTMRKPPFNLFEQLKVDFDAINVKHGLKEQLIPYFISSHPACRDCDMRELVERTKRLDFRLEQVQDFTPTPMTLSSTIYYAGIDPYTMQEVYTATTREEKLRQRDAFFWYKNGGRPAEGRSASPSRQPGPKGKEAFRSKSEHVRFGGQKPKGKRKEK
ncbi:YgiQ family radical SAM protein [uncultured Acetobacteroides sp.]|uniref:YgiQ family radical SAM protein n=1 Tax=uncultured Acetobacteroides sp. TaxID=1760811 RepID=UPI0029F5070B|nr:YgiQ family radical SAM protein [uncultured Acetobacteroides sp.]